MRYKIWDNVVKLVFEICGKWWLRCAVMFRQFPWSNSFCWSHPLFRTKRRWTLKNISRCLKYVKRTQILELFDLWHLWNLQLYHSFCDHNGREGLRMCQLESLCPPLQEDQRGADGSSTDSSIGRRRLQSTPHVPECSPCSYFCGYVLCKMVPYHIVWYICDCISLFLVWWVPCLPTQTYIRYPKLCMWVQSSHWQICQPPMHSGFQKYSNPVYSTIACPRKAIYSLYTSAIRLYSLTDSPIGGGTSTTRIPTCVPLFCPPWLRTITT